MGRNLIINPKHVVLGKQKCEGGGIQIKPQYCPLRELDQITEKPTQGRDLGNIDLNRPTR